MFSNFSIELVPSDTRAIDTATARLQPGTIVSLTWVPSSNPMNVVAPAARLRQAGLLVMPHVGARHLENREQLEQLADRLVSEAGVDRILLIGGDRTTPAGPFDSSLAVLKTGVFQERGIARVAVAGFPEGNPHIPAKDLDEALAAKAKFAHSEGLHLSIVTQFCFAAEPIVAWLKYIRAMGVDVPVRVGLAGPAGLVTLLRYAVRCGIGNSVHVLMDNPTFARALANDGPDAIIRGLSDLMGDQDRAELGIEGLHFYPFGGIGKTLDWINIARSRTPVFSQL